jgi:peroxiredoxin
MNRRAFLAVAALAIGALGFGYQASAQKTIAATKAEIGKPFLGPKLREIISGSDLDLASYKGKKVVIGVFLQQNCGTTWTYETQMGELIKKYKKQGVEVVGIHTASGERDSDIRGMLEQRNLTMPIMIDTKESIPMAKYVGAVCSPTFIVIDKAGILRYVGAYDKYHKAPSYVPDAVDAILANKPVKVTKTAAFG